MRSVDRIVCFDAFHHAPNPRAVIREFGRVLADGGIAGVRRARTAARRRRRARSSNRRPTASSSATSTCTISGARRRRAASATCGCASFTGRRITCRSRDTRTCSRAGRSQDAWLASTRKFLRHVRSFSLVKGGAGRADSRSVDGPRVRHPRDALDVARRRRRSRIVDRRRSSPTPAPPPGWPRTRRAGGVVARHASLRRVRRARVVRLPHRAADRSAARDRAGRNRAVPRHARRRSPPAAIASSSIASPPTSPGSRRPARVLRCRLSSRSPDRPITRLPDRAASRATASSELPIGMLTTRSAAASIASRRRQQRVDRRRRDR